MIIGASGGSGFLFIIIIAFLLLYLIVVRPQKRRQNEQRQAPPGPGVLRLLPPDAVTQHTINLAGRNLDYTATAGTLSLYDQSGERSAAGRAPGRPYLPGGSTATGWPARPP